MSWWGWLFIACWPWFSLGVIPATLGRRTLPQYLRWTVYQSGTMGDNGGDYYNRRLGPAGIKVGVVRRGQHVRTAFVAAESPTFEDDLIEAISQARRKAIMLNGNERGVRRRLP